ncbi:MAG: SDR family NAD(P)-dependent oxidoreductase, partial [Myxococcota bacterium]
VAIVTGANSGIGFETARVLAERGAKVVFACRSEERALGALERLSKDARAQSSFMPLDLADLDSVRAFAASFREGHGRLDLLINNAGVMFPPESQTRQGYELQFGVNHVGHFALTGWTA